MAKGQPCPRCGDPTRVRYTRQRTERTRAEQGATDRPVTVRGRYCPTCDYLYVTDERPRFDPKLEDFLGR